ncbi:MAG TPA: L,D-transpeptidase family protein [Anaerolineaceae bacterium]
MIVLIIAVFTGFGWIVPGVEVEGIPLGWMDREKAASVIDKKLNLERPLVVGDGNQQWMVQSIEFGLLVDANATAEQAFQVGRGRDALNDLQDLILNRSSNISPVILFSETVARQQLEKWSLALSYPAGKPELKYKDGFWVVSAGSDGLKLDIENTLARFKDDPVWLYRERRLVFVMTPITGEQNPADLVRLRDQLNRPLKILAYDPISDRSVEVIVPVAVMAQWGKVEVSNGSTVLKIDNDGLFQYLAGNSSTLGSDKSMVLPAQSSAITDAWLAGKSIELLVKYHPTSYTVQAGDTLVKIGMQLQMPYWRILKANPGLDQNHLVAGQKLVIPSRTDLLPLPIIRNKRIVISISKQRMWLYENGKQIAEYVISTGIESSPTMVGVFQVQTHELNAYASVWDLTMPHFLGIYEAWEGFMNGIHGLPTLSNGRRLWENVLGKPASYGCIILNLNAAKTVYEWAENGVVVEIRN